MRLYQHQDDAEDCSHGTQHDRGILFLLLPLIGIQKVQIYGVHERDEARDQAGQVQKQILFQHAHTAEMAQQNCKQRASGQRARFFSDCRVGLFARFSVGSLFCLFPLLFVALKDFQLLRINGMVLVAVLKGNAALLADWDFIRIFRAAKHTFFHISSP